VRKCRFMWRFSLTSFHRYVVEAITNHRVDEEVSLQFSKDWRSLY
jgi:hypothetical protein